MLTISEIMNDLSSFKDYVEILDKGMLITVIIHCYHSGWLIGDVNWEQQL